MFKFKQETFKNGLRFIFIPIPQATSLTSLIMFGVGSKYETGKIRGISHFLEHMLFKGTKKRPEQVKIASEIERVGGIINAYTDKDLTCYWTKTSPRHSSLCLDLLADMTTNSLIRSQDLAKEKGVIIEEINMYEDDPKDKVGEYFENLIFGNNSLGWGTAGLKKTVLATDRQKMIDYWQHYYTAPNAVVAVAGGLKESDWPELKNEVARRFEGFKAEKVSRPKIIIDPLARKEHLQVKKELEQAHFVLGFPALDLNHPDRWILSLLSLILGGNMSSRLFVKIRDQKGWAYYIYSTVNFYQESGEFVIAAGVKTSAFREAIKICREELLNLSKTITAKEIAEAKTCFVGRLSLAMESSQAVADKFANSWLLRNKIETPEELIKKIEKIDLDQARKVLKDNLREGKLRLAAILPQT